MALRQTERDIELSKGAKHPRYSLTAGMGMLEFKASDEHPGGTISGYASVFDNVDLHGEIVKRGAFQKTLKERPSVFLMDSHRTFEGTAAIIGRTITMKEDDHGLRFTAMFSNTPLAQEIRTKIKEGILDRLSFGFSVLQEKMNRATGVRELLELKLHEISVVPFPANPEAGIDSVKGTADPAVVEFRKLMSDILSRRGAPSSAALLNEARAVCADVVRDRAARRIAEAKADPLTEFRRLTRR